MKKEEKIEKVLRKFSNIIKITPESQTEQCLHEVSDRAEESK
jgi:hypothetical protein